MKEFFKNYFFFLIDKERKTRFRDKVMKNDHRTYRVLLVVIMILQLIMFVTSFMFTPKGENLNVENYYRISYAFLFVVCLACYFLIMYFYKKNHYFAYFMVISFTMLAIILWGGCISLLDSIEHTDLTYFAITTIACASFICLEPWVSSLACLLGGIAFNLGFVLIPSVKPVAGFGFYVGLCTIVGAALVGISFNFYRRIKAIDLELEVSDLNGILHEKAYFDDLTQIHNRRYLTEHIDDELHYEDPTTGILMIDLDHFKNINDTYGHQIGDTCLSFLGSKLNELIKSRKAYALRYGGEEFLVYFDRISKEELVKVAEDFRKTIEKSKISIHGGVKISYTVSIGLALAKDEITYNNLINEADQALYRAKKTRNSISF